MPTKHTADRGQGLDSEGFILREGALDRIQPPYRDIVDDLRQRVLAAFPHRSGLYLYGSVPRGTAVPGSSDLDALLVLPGEPKPVDQERLKVIERDLDAAHHHVAGVGILSCSRDHVLSDAERYDTGFFVKCLCTPLHGEDLGSRLPRYRPSARLARDTNGDIADAVARARADTGDPTALCRRFARKLVRTAFTLVMPCWGGWTSDMELTCRVVTTYHPEWDEPMRQAVRLARRPDAAAVGFLLDFGERLTAEYARTVGLKQPTAP